MRTLAMMAIGALALAGGGADARKPRQTPEAKLAERLKDFAPEKPVRCVDLQRLGSSEIIDRTAILYRSTGGLYYLNRPRGGQSALGWDDVLVTRTFGSQLCDGDVIRLIDRSSRMESGFVILDDFVPYRRVKKR